MQIPARVIYVVADVIGNVYFSHNKINALFARAGAPGEAPEGTCVDKCAAWLKRCNTTPGVDPLAVLGEVLEEFMERPFANPRRAEIDKVLQREGLSYAKGKIIPLAVVEELASSTSLEGASLQKPAEFRSLEPAPSEKAPSMEKAAVASRRAVVLTALGLEFRAVQELLTNLHEVTHPTVGTVYEVGHLSSSGGDWEVALTEMGVGNPMAAMETTRAIEHFKANVVMFVGVAGGLKDVKLGDVVAASKVYGYEGGKDSADGFKPRPDLGKSGYALVQRARAEARRTDWLMRVRGMEPTVDSVVHVGPIAAGEKVLGNASSELVAFLRQNYSDALAVEMEGFGVIQAAQQHKVDALVVRGISDLIDGKADADQQGWQARAARLAAAFALQVLARL